MSALPSALVIGDVMLDRFIEGAVSRVSPEAPVPVVRRRRNWASPGGAGNVAANIASLGGRAFVAGVRGDEPDGRYIETLLGQPEYGIQGTVLLPIPYWATPTKTRVIGERQQLVRIDDESAAPPVVPVEFANAITTLLDQPAHNVRLIVISDYNKGTMSEPLAAWLLAESTRRGIIVFVDAKPSHIGWYRGASLYKPNLVEAREAIEQIGTVHPGLTPDAPATVLAEIAAGTLQKRYGFGAVVVTCGEHGAVCRYGQRTEFVTSKARQVWDVSGAGDTFLAGLAVACLESQTFERSLHFAAAAAGLAVSSPGVTRVKRADLDAALYAESGPAAKLFTEETLLPFVHHHREAGRAIVLANGCFDALHAGHIQMLHEAKSLVADGVLVVAYNDDASLTELKGPSRPIVPDSYRASHLAQLACVDAVVRFDGDVETLVRKLRPEVLVKGDDTVRSGALPGEDYVASKHGRIEFIPVRFPVHSSLLVASRSQDENSNNVEGSS